MQSVVILPCQPLYT